MQEIDVLNLKQLRMIHMLINCMECGAQISDKASACPKCGNPMRKGLFESLSSVISNKINSIFESLNARHVEEEQKSSCCSFTIDMPYSQPHSAIASGEVRRRLLSAKNFSDVKSALEEFSDPITGYRANVDWFRKATERNPSRYFITLSYLAHCFDDNEILSRNFPSSDHHLDKERGAEALVRFGSSTADEKTKSYLTRYVSFSDKYIDYYNKKIDWSKFILETPMNMDAIAFFQECGMRVAIGEHDKIQKQHMHIYDCPNWKYETNLSKALDADDLDRVKFLLAWGASPNVFLGYGFSRSDEKQHWHTDPLLYHICSKEAFDLMTNAGMNWYPPSSDASGNYNLISHLWQSCFEMLCGKKLELLEYLYGLGYDKPLLKDVEYVRKQLRLGSYGKNRSIVVEWLDRVDFLSKFPFKKKAVDQ